MTGAFQCAGNHTLMFAAGASFFTGQNFGMRRHEPAQKLRVLVVNI